jgi:hypothetical protein
VPCQSRIRRAVWFASLATAAPSAVALDLPDGLVLDLRYRYAHIEETGFEHTANPNTLRVTIGYLWKPDPHWSTYVEGTRVSSLFGDNYNSGINGRTNLPAEGDPPSSQISSAWFGYANDDARARLGRQYINLDNQRFFTSGLWRQTPQSFDAFSGSWRLSSGTTLAYLYLDNAHRSVGYNYPDPTQREWSLNGNLFHIDQEIPLGKLTGYDYLVENHTQAKYSWRTAGLRWTGEAAFGATGLAWSAEFAQQSSWRNNPADYTVNYSLLEAGYGWQVASLRLGDERLGGDGHNAFSSPYGSNHAFNGWTSQFKSVPAAGLDDRYVTASGRITKQLSWGITNHNFFALRDLRRYGSELNVIARYTLLTGLDIEGDYADYHRNTFGVSERAFWLIVEYRHGQPGGG